MDWMVYARQVIWFGSDFVNMSPCFTFIQRELRRMLRYQLKLYWMFWNMGSNWTKKLYSFIKTSILAVGLANPSSSGSYGRQTDELLPDLSYIFVNMRLFSHLNSECLEMRTQFDPFRLIEGRMLDNWLDLDLNSLICVHVWWAL